MISERLIEAIFDPIEKVLLNNMPAWEVRKSTHEMKLDFLEIEVLNPNWPDPFPCWNIKVYPNGKEIMR